MSHLLKVVITMRKAIMRCIFLLALALGFSPTIAQSEVTIFQPINGQFVRGINVNQFEEETGIIGTAEGTWSIIQTSTLLSVVPRPLWSPNGQQVAIRFVGESAGVVSVPDNSIIFTTESAENGLDTSVDLITFPRGWSSDGDVLTVQYALSGGLNVIANIDLTNNIVQEIHRWQTGTDITDMPLPPDVTSVQLTGGYRIDRNPVFDDWLIMQFDSTGYYDSFDISEPIAAPINVLWNFRTNEYISLDALVPDLWISYRPGDWSHDGTRLLLTGVSKDLLNKYILTFRFAPEQGATFAGQAGVYSRTPQHWLDAGDLFFSIVQDYQGGAAYMLGEIVDGEYREMPFFNLNGNQFQFESFGDWYMQADEAERHRLSCLFNWPLETRFSDAASAQVIADDGVGLRLRAAPDIFSQQVGLLAEDEVVTITSESACSGGYRWWLVTTSSGITGWAAEADRSEYFLQRPATPTPTSSPSPTPTPAPFQRVRLTALCSANPAAYRVWRVRSMNAYDVVVDWAVYNSPTGQAGFVVAPPAQGSTPGEITFITQREPGPNTVRIFVNGVLQDTKASNPAQC